VAVEGRDEVAQLASAFNASAERIERLVTAQKRVLASASHELRAPLTRLRMTLELLEEPEGLSAERRSELTRRGAADVEELDALVADVLLAARLEQGTERRFDVVDLAQLAREVAADAEVAVTAAELSGQGDAGMLRRMLRNLVDNAKRHGGGAGVELVVEAGVGGAVVAVLDRGPGVPEAERERIFEPFYRPQGHSEGRDGGVGLGLSLVRHVAEHHGGRATCAPRDGGGSRFEVTLPGFA
jgi:signal transduction histidine kinase